MDDEPRATPEQPQGPPAPDPCTLSHFIRLCQGLLPRAVHGNVPPCARPGVSTGDVVQSLVLKVVKAFRAGRFDSLQERQLKAYLRACARNKLSSLARRGKTEKRGGGRNLGPGPLEGQAQPGPGPAELAVLREILEHLRRAVSDEVLGWAHERAAGRTWRQIAGEDKREQDRCRRDFERAWSDAAGVVNAECRLRLDPDDLFLLLMYSCDSPELGEGE
jgi:hypothetical protein